MNPIEVLLTGGAIGIFVAVAAGLAIRVYCDR